MAKEVTCEAPCNFCIRSDNEDELVSITQAHCTTHHDHPLTRDEVLGMAKEV